MRQITLFTVLCLLGASAASAQVAPSAVFTFDKDFDGTGPRGPIAGRPDGKPVLAPGKVGQALKSGTITGMVQYPTAGVLNRTAGAVEMWVCPLDWEPKDGKFHTFFEMKGQGAFYLYKYFNEPSLLMLSCPELSGPYHSTRASVEQWKPGEWHHIAGTWSPRGVQVFVDGKPSTPKPAACALPKALGEFFTIGDQPWQFPRDTASLIDEVRLYDRALTPAHVAAHYAGDTTFSLPLKAEAAGLDYEIDPDTGRVEARLDTGSADVDDASLAARVALVAKGGALPEGAARCSFAGGEAVATLSLPDRKPGAYEVVAQFLRDGKPAFDLRRDLVLPSLDWLGNRLGLEDKVLPPWTPLSVLRASDARNTTIECWGRKYTFAGTALPAQIASAGADLLARPVALRLKSAGKELAWEDAAAKVESASKTQAVLAGAATAKGEGVSARFTTRVTAEYDGLVLFEVTCEKPDALPLEGMTLEIPVKGEHAIYRHRYASSWIPVSGNTPAGEGLVESQAFVPFVWLGDNDRGLFWFTETDEMWPNAEAKNAVEIVRAGGEVAIRLNLLAAGQKLPANWKFVFGLQATPVKPLPKEWRKWRMTGNAAVPKANVNIVWPNPKKKDSLSDFGFPQAADPKEFQGHIDALHKAGLKAIPYLCLTFVTDRPPEWRYFKKIWELGPIDSSIPEVGWDHQWPMVSPVGKGYADWMMARTKEFLERYGIDGVYHDQTHPYTSSNTAAGVGYVRDGKERNTFPILGYRALYRRNYAVVKSLPRETFTMAHMSGKVTIPILAYEDSYLDGEHFRGVVKDSYLDVTTLDSFRAEYMGRQWGIMPFFLPEFDAEHAKQVEPTRGMMGLLMIHDVNVWPIWCNTAVVVEAFSALDAFGYVDADFVPYFDPQPPAATEMKDVYASAYKKAGRALVIVANLSREDRQGEVRLDAGRLGVPLTKVVTWPDKQPVAVAGDKVRLEVPRLGYRMLMISR